MALLALAACLAAGFPRPARAAGGGADSAGDTAAARPARIPRDSAGDTAGQQRTLYEYIAYPTVEVLTWPVEKVLVPAVDGLLYPIKPPLKYFINEDVIDRTIRLISFGGQDQIQVYPTMVLTTVGTSSNTGLTFRDQRLFGRSTETLVAQFSYFVNGDYRFRSYGYFYRLFGTEFSSRLNVNVNRVRNTSINEPGTNAFLYYADTSELYGLRLGHPLFEKVNGSLGVNIRNNLFGTAPPGGDSVVSGFFMTDGRVDSLKRGLASHWRDLELNGGLNRDTRNNENITLRGSYSSLGYSYHLTDAHHDFLSTEAEWMGYFKLGKEKYEISAKEEKRLGKVDIKRMLENLEIERLKQQIFNRKVVILHLYAGRSYELPGNHMPTYGLMTIGNGTPMRGYAGSRFRDKAAVAFGAEYRFPVLRLVDGTIFDEYGNVGPDFSRIDYLGVKNSWGFGIRLRRPDLFLFRFELGFHGANGIVPNLTVDSPF